MRLILSTALLVCIAWIGAIAQSTEKDVIIIEKTIDENGNEVSKKIIRRQGDDFSDEELEELLETDERPFGQMLLTAGASGSMMVVNLRMCR